MDADDENCVNEDEPGQEDDEGVEVEVGLALRLCLVVRPDHRQHRHALDISCVFLLNSSSLFPA